MRGVRTRVLVAIAALPVLAAACGGDANDGGATGSGPTATGETDSGSGDHPGAGDGYRGSYGMTGATGATGAKDADLSVSLNN